MTPEILEALRYGAIAISAFCLFLTYFLIRSGDAPNAQVFGFMLFAIVVLAASLLADRNAAIWVNVGSSNPTLPASICTTEKGEIGSVRLVTGIFNEQSGSFHGYRQEQVVSAGTFAISANDVQDISSQTSSFLEKHWGAMWECMS